MKKPLRPIEIEKFFAALSDRTRLRLLNLLGDDEVCVCFLVEILGVGQPKVSRHLAYLRQAGVVAARREGKWMHYRIIEPLDPHAAKIFQALRAWLKAEPHMQGDRNRLAEVCCATDAPLQLQKAPRPATFAA